MSGLISKILGSKPFEGAPPVLVDIGASGSLPKQWKALAPFSVCIAFDADTRDFQVRESSGREWKKLYSLNRLVAPVASESVPFYLTKSPHCSSSLKPNNAALKPWAFHRLFELETTTTLPSIDLPTALRQVGVEWIDWFKCDTQGTDLRIFRSLSPQVIDGVLAADFEPGIIDAYVGEDKLHQLMAYMDSRPFWVSDMAIKGSQRLADGVASSLSALQQRQPGSFLKTAPGWCEISYLNDCESPELGEREVMLAWVFASVKEHHGFALQLAQAGTSRFHNSLFNDMSVESKRRIAMNYTSVIKGGWRKLARRVVAE
jgi:hypothetical protein